jgi:hypothetical protein
MSFKTFVMKLVENSGRTGASGEEYYTFEDTDGNQTTHSMDEMGTVDGPEYKGLFFFPRFFDRDDTEPRDFSSDDPRFLYKDEDDE